jgi:lipoprotein-releasing system ATP-binding protein
LPNEKYKGRNSVSEICVRVENVKKHYGNAIALDGISLSLNTGEQYVIQGASGSGKSTLLYLIGGLDRPTEGRIDVQGHSLSDFNDERLALYRNRFVGFVFQFHFLLSTMNCLDNILLPAKIGQVEIAPVAKLASELANDLGVSHCLSKFPYELSGGEQQRINIIRALSLKPKLLLCDEPTGNLDSHNSQKVISLLTGLAKKYNSTLVVVTHDDNVASHFNTRFQINDGALLEHCAQ